MEDRLTPEALQTALERGYLEYSEPPANAGLLDYWKRYFDSNPDQIEFGITVLLNLEKAKQIQVSATRLKHSKSEVFLRDSDTLATCLLLHILNKIDDAEYFASLKTYAEKIHGKLTELNLDQYLSDSELDDPDSISDINHRSKVVLFLNFLNSLEHPLLNSLRFKKVLGFLARIDLGNISWLDKAHVLIAQSEVLKKSGLTNEMQQTLGTYGKLNEKTQKAIQEKYRLFQFEFLNKKQIQKTLQQITQRTEKYSADLDQEITDSVKTFLKDNPGKQLTLTLENKQEKKLTLQNNQLKIDDQNITIENGKINANSITSAKESGSSVYEQFENSSPAAKSINEKIQIRYHVAQLQQTLENPEKSPLEKTQEFAQMLYTKTEGQDSTFAERIEATKTGFDYVKDVAAIITSGIAFVSVIGIIPMLAYRYKSHKWLWESHRGNFLDDAKTASTIQAKLQSKKGTR